MKRRQGRFYITEELLADLLGLPEDTVIVSVYSTNPSTGIEITVHHPSLKELEEGEKPPVIITHTEVKIDSARLPLSIKTTFIQEGENVWMSIK